MLVPECRPCLVSKPSVRLRRSPSQPGSDKVITTTKGSSMIDSWVSVSFWLPAACCQIPSSPIRPHRQSPQWHAVPSSPHLIPSSSSLLHYPRHLVTSTPLITSPCPLLHSPCTLLRSIPLLDSPPPCQPSSPPFVRAPPPLLQSDEGQY